MARSRFLRGLGVGVLVTLAMLTLASSYVWSLALSDACQELERVDLSIEEMVALKKKVDDAVREGSNVVILTGPETSFVLREFLRLPVFIEVGEGQVGLQAAWPRDEQCYNVAFRGELAIVDGVAFLHPQTLMVGELDLSWWLGDTIEVSPMALTDDDTVALLDHLQRVEVDGEHVRVEVDDLQALR